MDRGRCIEKGFDGAKIVRLELKIMKALVYTENLKR